MLGYYIARQIGEITMTVIVTDSRTILDQADSLTGWTTPGATASAQTFVEAPNALIDTLNIATGQLYFTGTAFDASDTLVYVWANNFALQGLWQDAAPPLALVLGDAVDLISFKMSGYDRKVFSHLTNQDNGWECLVLDGSQAATMDAAGDTVARAGSFAALDLTNITRVGADFTTLSKGLGGGTNVAIDIIRYGNGGIVITGGLTGTRGNFAEIVIEDQSTVTLKAHGIIREYSTGIYGVQGPITFGDATAVNWFDDDGVVIAFEDRNISDDKYYLAVVGGTGSNNFFLSNSTITTAGPLVRCDFDGLNVEQLSITSCTFSGLGNPITFASDVASASHIVTGNSFTGCGQIDPGEVIFETNTISATTASTTGALLLDTVDASNLDGIAFVSGGTGHAIYITTAGTYSFTNFTYSGYSAVSPGSNLVANTGSTDAVVYNNSGGAVTINVTGGDSVTVRNGVGAGNSTTVNNNVTVTITVQDTATTAIVGAVVGVYNSTTNAELVNDETNGSGIVTFSTAASTPVYVRVLKSTTGSTRYTSIETVGNTGSGLSLTVTLNENGIVDP